MNISSVLIQTRPEFIPEVIQSISNRDWLDVHFSDDVGRIIATVEGADIDEEAAHITELQLESHILSVDMVNHYFSPPEESEIN